ncbi:hypothetical protein CO058_02690 [candidate division WWE3 bacterium CG_4_9_14_0_2_um_filter_35_11]|uniref:Uncharacterized protein n=1 Tax=candidate division WWE3 bacterium CG_4_9_14_0_2_um_filter_35_11 TaxID=1975077 RepID=A0A2M8ELM8_UNCKA|nr:MAG: hypothetical protein CO058_02690 [candidate division WWE3 bacterium CG_4_9_14_0_2_um_filter_35_11]
MNQITSIIPVRDETTQIPQVSYIADPVQNGATGRYWAPSKPTNPNPGQHTIYVSEESYKDQEPPWICELDDDYISDRFLPFTNDLIFAYRRISNKANKERIINSEIQDILNESVREHEKSHLRQEIIYSLADIDTKIDLRKSNLDLAIELELKLDALKEIIAFLDQIDYLQKASQMSEQDILANIFGANLISGLRFQTPNKSALEILLNSISTKDYGLPNLGSKYILAILATILEDTDILEKLERQETTPKKVTENFANAITTMHLGNEAHNYRQGLLRKAHEKMAETTLKIVNAGKKEG